ncbi:MAG: substrate-binding periplasmic protein [Pseudomonadales bacterium]
MKRFRHLISALLMLSAAQLYAEPNAMRIGYADYRPYSYLEQEHPVGIEVDVLNRLGAALNIPLEHKVMPWKRVQSMVKSGALDAYIAVLTPERERYAVAGSQVIASAAVSLFVHRDSEIEAQQMELSALQGLQIGAINGNSWAKTHLDPRQIHPVGSMDALTQMLLRKRVDAIAENRFIFADYLKQFDLKGEVREIRLNAPSLKLVLLVSKHSPFAIRVDDFDSQLAKMHHSGEMQRILDQYR